MPSGVLPSRNVTDPVGVPAVELTVTVKLAALCENDGLALEDMLAAAAA
jgi:hypothetical protein